MHIHRKKIQQKSMEKTMPKQFEDNATKALVYILNGKNKAKAKLIFNFLFSKYEGNKPKFEDLSEVSMCQNLKNNSIPDIVLNFKNGFDYKVEVKDKNTALTSSEKEIGNRDVFVIPSDYPENYKILIPVKNVITWEELFKEIDINFGGECFDELNVTRDSLGLRTIAGFDSFLAKGLEVFLYMIKDKSEIKFSKLSQIPQDSTYQGFWIQFNDHYCLSFDKTGIYIEYEYEDKKDINKITKVFKEKYGPEYENLFYEYTGNNPSTFYTKVSNRMELMSKDAYELAKKILQKFTDFDETLNTIN